MGSRPPADAVLVFAHTVDRHGQLSAEQVLRMRKGMELLRKNKAKFLIVSGGLGKSFNGTRRPIGWHMKKFAVAEGVQARKVVAENRSSSTIENVVFTKRLMARREWKSAILVSSAYHIPRIRMICRYVFPSSYKLSYMGVRVPASRWQRAEGPKLARDEVWLKKRSAKP